MNGKRKDCRRPEENKAPDAPRPILAGEEMHAILAIVTALTGNDFSSYKKDSVLRSIDQRMKANGLARGEAYIVFLVQNPIEAQLLCQELKIPITNFFRDPEAFDVLRRQVIAPLLAAAGDPGNPVRIWNVCCATGEEAYSIAMLVRECLERHGSVARVQIFATDIDEGAVNHAKAGRYSDEALSKLEPDRRDRFFTRSKGLWQVTKLLRETIIFARHRILRDPPFSKLDLIVCRNFLVYLNTEMQQWLLSLFHMVLKPDGFLFLGPMEALERSDPRFIPVDSQWRIFRKQTGAEGRDVFHPFSYAMWKRFKSPHPPAGASTLETHPLTQAQAYLIGRYTPPCVLVNEKNEVLHFLSGVQGYLKLPPGEPTLDLLRMVRQELRPALRSSIRKALSDQKEVYLRRVRVALDSGKSAVNVRVVPLVSAPYYGKMALVVLEPVDDPTALLGKAGGKALSNGETLKDALIRQLEEQLNITQEQLQTTIDQLEASNEGFMTANEELMSVNEEFQVANEQLRSTNDELEVSKKEMEILNQQVVAVNTELQKKVAELKSINTELESFIYSVSHDLKGPLRAITGFSDILEHQYADKLDGKARDYLAHISRGADKMARLIQDLLRLSGISRQEMTRRWVDLSSMASNIVAELREIQPDREVTVDIQEGLTAQVDPALFAIMLSNLLRNAWKFTGKTSMASIAFRSIDNNGNRAFYVRDNGVGFDPTYAERMFLPFHRLHTADAFEGTGIGLAIVERIVGRHGGRVWAEGAEGDGATIFFTVG